MNIEDIEVVITEIHQWKAHQTKYELQIAQHLQSQQQLNNVHLYDYQTIKGKIFEKVLPLLTVIKDELQEYRRRDHENQQQIQILKEQLQVKQDEIMRLDQKIKFLQQIQQQLNSQMDHLNHNYIQKVKQNQLREQAAELKISQFTNNNQILNQELQVTYLKYKSLQMIVDKQKSNRQCLQIELAIMKNEEKQLIITIQKMRQSIQNEKLRYHRLQIQLSQKNRQLGALNEYIQGRSSRLVQRIGQGQDNARQFTKQQTIEQRGSREIVVNNISDLTPLDEKQYLILNQPIESYFWRSSQDQRTIQQHNFMQQSINSQLHHNSLQSVQRGYKLKHHHPELSMYPSFVIYQHYYNSSKPDINTSLIQVEDLNKNKHELLVQINNCAQNRLKNFCHSHYQMMIQTQSTERQIEPQISIGHTQILMDKGYIQNIYSLDPYFIHYTLMVQSIKIEEDEDGLYGILQIDMRDNYKELMDDRISVCQWGNWIREKLFSIHRNGSQPSI